MKDFGKMIKEIWGGIETKANGVVYEAYFVNDVKSGDGAIIKNGRRTEGHFSGDEFKKTSYSGDRKSFGYLRAEYGNVYDENGEKVGRIDDYGQVYDSSGNRVGKIDKDGEMYDKDGRSKGKFGNGEIMDRNGNRVGEVKDGDLYDRDGYRIGRYRGNENDIAAAQFLLNND